MADYVCPRCGSDRLKTKRTRQRNPGSGACLFELIGLVVFAIGFLFWPLLIVGLAFIILGHNAAYRTVRTLHCRDCKAKTPIG